MKMDEPIGNPSWGPFFLRVAISAYFIMAGLSKLENPEGFLAAVRGMQVLPERAAIVFGIILPYLEIFAGTLCLIGFWTTLASILIIAMLGSFIIAIGIKPSPLTPFNKDIVLLAATFSLLYTGAGAISLDRFRKGG